MFNKLINQFNTLIFFSFKSDNSKSIMFFAEDGNYWEYFYEIYRSLSKNSIRTFYITSSYSDRLLSFNLPNISAHYIGNGIIRSLFFLLLDFKFVFTTTPDINNNQIKRSLVHNVKYIYVHHSIVSSHMVYNQKAFDNFDVILCVGEHHYNETRRNESVNNLKKKELLKCGYPKFDLLNESNYNPVKMNILIAPSWGNNSISASCITEIIEHLLINNYHVIYRPHPRTYKYFKEDINSIKRKYFDRSFSLDLDFQSNSTYHTSEFFISDWSGSAFEFAFFTNHPVIFIDVPKKINNENYEKLKLVPVEESLRNKIGKIVQQDEIEKINNILDDFRKNIDSWKITINEIKKRTIYNLGKSGSIVSDYISDHNVS